MSAHESTFFCRGVVVFKIVSIEDLGLNIQLRHFLNNARKIQRSLQVQRLR